MEQMIKGLAALTKVLGYKFRKSLFLYEALTHPSCLANKRYLFNSYQRLEFLGDGVIDLVTAEKLFHMFPKDNEGTLTRYKSIIVSGNNLAKIAKQYHLGDYLTLSNGARNAGLESDEYILACVFEAVIGAIFLDSGCNYFAIRRILEKDLLSDVNINILTSEKEIRQFDPKTHLQQLAQEKFQATPVYRIISQDDPREKYRHTVELVISGVRLGEAAGPSVQKAEKQVAINVLEKTDGMTKNIPPRLEKLSKIMPQIQYGSIEKVSVKRRRRDEKSA